jgi:hypothetical protein
MQREGGTTISTIPPARRGATVNQNPRLFAEHAVVPLSDIYPRPVKNGGGYRSVTG